MVYFQIDYLRIEEDELILDATVTKFTPKSSKDIMDLITRIARRMYFDYSNVDRALLHFGYLIAELGREKIYLTTVPIDTYGYFHAIQDGKQYVFDKMDIPVDIYIDVGSPFRHFYKVDIRKYEQHIDCNILGVSIDRTSDFSIFMLITPQHQETFHNDDEINIIIGDSIPPNTRKLINKAFSLHNLLSPNKIP
jgi:hypothetical protein